MEDIWSQLAPAGGLLAILGSLVAFNFRTLFRRDQQVWDLIEDYKAQVAERDTALLDKDKVIADREAVIEIWRERYYNLLVTGKPASLSDDTPKTGD